MKAQAETIAAAAAAAADRQSGSLVVPRASPASDQHEGGEEEPVNTTGDQIKGPMWEGGGKVCHGCVVTSRGNKF